MNFIQTLFITASLAAAAFSAAAQGLTPQAPTLNVTFEVEDDGVTGKLVGHLTAPAYDSSWTPLPADTKIRIEVKRSCYALGEENIIVANVDNLAPGEAAEFVDTATPAWQYGSTYVYTPTAYIGSNSNAWPRSVSITPGISFGFAYNTVTATANNVAKTVTVSATAPSVDNSQKPITLPMNLEFYRVTDHSVWPYVTELAYTAENVDKGTAYTWIDEHPTLNADNYYLVIAKTAFGSAQSSCNTYVGVDTPRDPYPIAAEAYDGGARIYWTAPTEGEHWGYIDPSTLTYNVYRCWGRNTGERVLIAENISECEYIDYGTDMTAPRLVRYEVQSCNEAGAGMSGYSSFDYDLIVGPAESVPFVDIMSGGLDHVWLFGYTSYYAQMEVATQAVYGPNSTAVAAPSGSLVFVDYLNTNASNNSSNTMTSYKIDMTKTVNPAIKFNYYAIPDCDVTIELQASTDGVTFETLSVIPVSQTAEAGWVTHVKELSQYAGVRDLQIRIRTGFGSKPSSAIVSRLMLLDYSPVGLIDVNINDENMVATLTWDDPSSAYEAVAGYEGYVNGESVGQVSSPWQFTGTERNTNYTINVRALYDGVEAPLSAPVTVFFAKQQVEEFTASGFVFSILRDRLDAPDCVAVKSYTGSSMLLTVPEYVAYDDVSYRVVSVLDEAFLANPTLYSVSIPKSVTEIGARAFAGCSDLEAIGLPSALESLGEGAFRGCPVLHIITLPETLTAIPAQAFESCLALDGITIPAAVTSIGARAFADCKALDCVEFLPAAVPAVASDAFDGIGEGCLGICPSESLTDYQNEPALANIIFDPTGIESPIADPATARYFDLQGRPVANPTSGLYILRQGTHATKVILK